MRRSHRSTAAPGDGEESFSDNADTEFPHNEQEERSSTERSATLRHSFWSALGAIPLDPESPDYVETRAPARDSSPWRRNLNAAEQSDERAGFSTQSAATSLRQHPFYATVFPNGSSSSSSIIMPPRSHILIDEDDDDDDYDRSNDADVSQQERFDALDDESTSGYATDVTDSTSLSETPADSSRGDLPLQAPFHPGRRPLWQQERFNHSPSSRRALFGDRYKRTRLDASETDSISSYVSENSSSSSYNAFERISVSPPLLPDPLVRDTGSHEPEFLDEEETDSNNAHDLSRDSSYENDDIRELSRRDTRIRGPHRRYSPGRFEREFGIQEFAGRETLGVNQAYRSELNSPNERPPLVGHVVAQNAITANPFPIEDSSLLHEMYRAPTELMFRGNIIAARDIAKFQKKWILVHLLSENGLPCLRLNQDIWRDKDVVQVVRECFIFVQLSCFEADGRRYLNFYPVAEYPHVAILDPRTEERMTVFDPEDFASPDSFVSALTAFLVPNQFDITSVTYQEAQSKRRERRSLSNSANEQEPSSSNQSDAQQSCNLASNELDLTDQLELLDAFEVPEPVEGGILIQLRAPSGRNYSRRFAPTDRIWEIFRCAKSVFSEELQNTRFTMFFMGKNLCPLLLSTLEDEGIARALFYVVPLAQEAAKTTDTS